MSILVVGSVAFDSITTPFGTRQELLGGSATYFSLSARFFTPVKLVAVVGEDFPSRNITLLKKRGIDLEGLAFEKGKTFRWEGEYSWDFNNAKTLATHLNVFSSFNPRIPEHYRDSRYVFLANIDPVIQARVLAQVRRPKMVACDTMNHWINEKRDDLTKFLKQVDILLVNDGEARQLSEENNLFKAGRAIMRRGVTHVVIKKGEHGALLFSPRSVFCVPAYLLEDVFDPTGAGDTFAGGFMGYLARAGKLNDQTLRRAVVYGTVMATFTVEKFGVERLLEIKKPDIDRRLDSFKKRTCF